MFSGVAKMQLSSSFMKQSKALSALFANVVSIFLSVLLAWSLGAVAWFWVGTTPTSKKSVAAPVVSPSGSNPNQVQLDHIINSDLFGDFSADLAKNQTPKKPLKDAPITSLDLTLVGLVATNSVNTGWAVIAKGSAQQIYGTGETIEGTGVVLTQVFSDRVVLRNRERDELLMLDGVDKIDKQAKAAIVSSGGKSSKNTGKNTGKSDAAKDEVLAKIKAEIIRNPQSMLKYITLSQLREGGNLVGYRLGPGTDKRLYESAGIQNGDLAVAINGVDLKDPTKMNQIWKSLSDASEISLTVKRNEQLHNIYIGL